MDRLSEIRARCERATPGPWYWDAIDAHKCICLESARWKVMDFARYGMNGAAPRFLVDGIMERADSLLKSIPGKEHHRGFDNYIDHPDASFIAHAREDIPYLLAEVERLTEENANLREYEKLYQGICDKHQQTHRKVMEAYKTMTARAEKAEAEIAELCLDPVRLCAKVGTFTIVAADFDRDTITLQKSERFETEWAKKYSAEGAK